MALLARRGPTRARRAARHTQARNNRTQARVGAPDAARAEGVVATPMCGVHVWRGWFYIETGISCATRKMNCPATAREGTWSTKILVHVNVLSSQDILCCLYHMAGWVALAGCFDRLLWHKKNRFLYGTSRARPALANGHHTRPDAVVTTSPAPTFTPASSI